MAGAHGGTVSLGGYHFDVDPSKVLWSFSVKTSVKDTIGGRVIQIFGTQIDNMQVSGSHVNDDIQQRFVDAMTRLAEESSHYPNRPHRFLFPAYDWDFQVYIRGISTSDGEGSVTKRQDIVLPHWVLRLHIVEDNAGLKKIATDKYIERLSASIGWKQTGFNADDLVGTPSPGIALSKDDIQAAQHRRGH